MNEIKQPLHWVIKIWTTQGDKVFKHPVQYKTFEDAAKGKEALDTQLQNENTIRLYDRDKLLDLTINANQIISMKVSGVYEHTDEDDDRNPRGRYRASGAFPDDRYTRR